MLTALETFLLNAIRAELPNTNIVTGLLKSPAKKDLPVLNLIAHDLQTLPIDNEDEQLSPAFFTQRISLTGDGIQQDFILPIQGDVLEIELTSEKLAKLRDDYWQDDSTLHFYQAPIGQFTVLIKGALAQGYQTLKPSCIHLSLEAWHSNHTEADNLLSNGLAATLKAFVDLDRIELTRNELGFSLRLLKPVLELSSLEHDESCMRVKLTVHADLELNLAFGTTGIPSVI
ncbi:hypothetical protein BAC3_00230 [uncultured bacterium]|nr:hypothetical protein BAC3_00230 [uncultured bacterium]